jgi:glycerol-1-phosphate dehydrogenase [NAD(P)+]
MSGTDRVASALANASDTDELLIGAGAVSRVDEVYRTVFGDHKAVVVADENTYAVAGRAAHERLEAAGIEQEKPYIFPGKPVLHGEYEHIQTLIDSIKQHDAIVVAVGSGSLNDIAKRASYEVERRYMCIATAASMDGYTAFGAAISVEGYKQTLTCPAPKAVIGDLDVLTRAPNDMTASGYADLLGKVTAGADWIMADELGVEPIDPDVWALVQHPLREWTARPAELVAGDADAMNSLIEGLIMSGLAMQAAASSRPASGAEHQFSHLWEMEGLGYHDDPPLSHGFKVGLGSIAMAALYEVVLARDYGSLDVDAAVAAWPSADEQEAAVKENLAKYVEPDELRARLTVLRDNWPKIRDRAAEQLMPAAELRELLRQAGCPTSPAEIGLDGQRFKQTYVRSQMIRRRYTLLDVTKQTGTLEECVEELFAPGGFWADVI